MKPIKKSAKRPAARRTDKPAPRTTARRAAKRNGSELAAAAELSEQFHGRPPRRVREHEEPAEQRLVLADLGALREIEIETDDGARALLTFGRGVRLASSPDGGQLYLVGDGQQIDLEALGLAAQLPKDHISVGEAVSITYHTSKAFHDFDPSDYQHEFGEEGGTRPRVNYDTTNKRLYLSGGSYQVKPEGIVN
jgi:hypothetical protein